MKISKEKAQEAAKKITEPLLKKCKEAEAALAEYLTVTLSKKIPKEVQALHEKWPGYFRQKSSFYIKGIGYTSLTKCIVEDSFELTKTEMQHAVKLDQEHEKAKEHYKKTFSEIEAAILQLGTINRVKENMPEALPYIPDATITTVAVNIQPVRTKIKSLTGK